MSHTVAHCSNCRVIVYDPDELTDEEIKEHLLPPLPEHGIDGDFYAYCYICHDWKPFHVIPDLSDI